MSERRTLLALLLIVVTVVLYIWGKQSARQPEKPTPPEKAEAEERAKAEPFPLPVEGKTELRK